ncbi:MAG TPA: low temperature requirement protein A, partial [Lysobacter sp.]|nr:low temperature requirement protein A [Lysobacter sp.]
MREHEFVGDRAGDDPGDDHRMRVGVGRTRFAWWALALSIESIAPIAFFWVPGLGRSTIEDWDVEGAHLAERCALFVII